MTFRIVHRYGRSRAVTTPAEVARELRKLAQVRTIPIVVTLELRTGYDARVRCGCGALGLARNATRATAVPEGAGRDAACVRHPHWH